jgi:hypothetical protein
MPPLQLKRTAQCVQNPPSSVYTLVNLVDPRNGQADYNFASKLLLIVKGHRR